MKRLDRMGFTTVEVLVCFVVVAVVMMALFSTISAFNDKKVVESNRAKIYEFKNMVTNTIQEDLIQIGVISAKITPPKTENAYSGCGNNCDGTKYILDLSLRDGTQRKLVVFRRYVKTNYRINGKVNGNDIFYIQYGDPSTENFIQYDLPDLGEEIGYYDSGAQSFVVADTNYECHSLSGGGSRDCQTVKSLQINNVFIEITNEADVTVSGHILKIYIGFYHPDFGSKYGINIVAPIDFQSNISDASSKFSVTTNPNSTSAIYMPS